MNNSRERLIFTHFKFIQRCFEFHLTIDVWPSTATHTDTG